MNAECLNHKGIKQTKAKESKRKQKKQLVLALNPTIYIYIYNISLFINKYIYK